MASPPDRRVFILGIWLSLLFVFALVGGAAGQLVNEGQALASVAARGAGAPVYAVPGLCCKGCPLPAGCCCGAVRKVPVTKKTTKFTTVKKTRTVLVTRTSTFTAANKNLAKRDAASFDDQTAGNAKINLGEPIALKQGLSGRSLAGAVEPVDAETSEVASSLAAADTDKPTTAHELFARHLCPVCPAGKPTVPANFGKHNTGGSKTVYCCPARKTVTKTYIKTKTSVKSKTSTIVKTTTVYPNTLSAIVFIDNALDGNYTVGDPLKPGVVVDLVTAPPNRRLRRLEQRNPPSCTVLASNTTDSKGSVIFNFGAVDPDAVLCVTQHQSCSPCFATAQANSSGLFEANAPPLEVPLPPSSSTATGTRTETTMAPRSTVTAPITTLQAPVKSAPPSTTTKAAVLTSTLAVESTTAVPVPTTTAQQVPTTSIGAPQQSTTAEAAPPSTTTTLPPTTTPESPPTSTSTSISQSPTPTPTSTVPADTTTTSFSATNTPTATETITPGAVLYDIPGTYQWTAPESVYEVHVACVGAGGGGGYAEPASAPTRRRLRRSGSDEQVVDEQEEEEEEEADIFTSEDHHLIRRGTSLGYRAAGGGGGGLGWANNIPVTPGQNYTVVVGLGGSNGTFGSNGTAGGDSYFINTTTVAGFGGGPAVGGSHYPPSQGGDGGDTVVPPPHGPTPARRQKREPILPSSSGGGGAAGYLGNGGKGGAAGIEAAGNGSGGAGAGGFGSGTGTYPYFSASGGGVWLKGYDSTVAIGGSDPNTAGQGGSFGCDGVSENVYNPRPPLGAGGGANQLGGNGACRIVWGDMSWPSNVPTMDPASC